MLLVLLANGELESTLEFQTADLLGKIYGRFCWHFSSRINQTADEAQDLPKFAVCSRTDSPRQSGHHQILLAWLRREKKTVLLFG